MDDPEQLVPDDVQSEPIEFAPPDEDFAPDFALRRGEYANEGQAFAVVAAAVREHGHELDEEDLSELKVWARAISNEELDRLTVEDDDAGADSQGVEPRRLRRCDRRARVGPRRFR
jgi:hypothetical protein